MKETVSNEAREVQRQLPTVTRCSVPKRAISDIHTGPGRCTVRARVTVDEERVLQVVQRTPCVSESTSQPRAFYLKDG